MAGLDLKTCPHFGTCGGCSLQDLAPDVYRARKREAVLSALTRAGIEAAVEEPVVVPPRSRRRAVFKIKSLPEGLHIGFHAAQSHTVIDMHHCEVLTPGLFALVGALRQKLEPLFGVGEMAELHVTETDTGFDCAFRWRAGLTPALTAALSSALSGLGIARLTMGRDTVFETALPIVTLGGAKVVLPPNPFLQPTAEGEAALQAQVLERIGKAKFVVDLFAGCGTFALPLARKVRVHAVEQDKPALAALAEAAKSTGLKPVTTEVRDLFKLPLTALELKPYDAVVLDPPRAGAEAQAKMLAKSKVPVIAYVSCDAASFARDAALLIAGGYRLGPVTPIDQFLWSSHIELAAFVAFAGPQDLLLRHAFAWRNAPYRRILSWWAASCGPSGGAAVSKRLIALGVVLAAALAGAALMFLDGASPVASKEPEPQSHLVDFSHWAAVLVAGDYRAHNGAPSKVFDNGRRDLAQAFAKIGFSPANMLQFSVDYDDGTQHAGIAEIGAGMQTMAAKAPGGCLMYFTSHGTPDGMVIGDAILSPGQMRDMVAGACGARPTVVVMSACYSGTFVAALQGPNRIVMTAARPDRTSFGCGEMDHYTFFDDCFLRAMPMAGDFPGLGALVQQCVGEREVQMKATPPSEPQVSVGPNLVFTLRWRDTPAVPPGGAPTDGFPRQPT